MTQRHVSMTAAGALTGVLTVALAVVTPAAQARSSSFIGGFTTITTIASTVPANGDVNPYGMAIVPRSTGALRKGSVLISNFNDSANLQGTGSTIDEITPGGQVSLFASITASAMPGPCPGGVGLTTALVALKSGFVIVGSLPTADGTAATAQAGCLIVLNRWGQMVETFADRRINGPWDMTAVDRGEHVTLFVTNVLNGTVAAGGAVVHGGTVLRIGLDLAHEDGRAPAMASETVIGSGFAERTDPAALVIGPTGVSLGRNGVLYVADSLNNRIAAIPNAMSRESSAGVGATVTENGALNDPLGLTLAPNGHILTVNGNDGFMIETTPHGAQVATQEVDSTGSPPGAGTLFGLVVAPGRDGVEFVDDGSNTLDLLH
jgi:hypothetical protein